MTIKTKADLTTEANTNIADNSTKDISASDVRNLEINQIDTMAVITAAVTDEIVPRFDGTDGTLQETGISVDDSDNVTGVTSINGVTTGDFVSNAGASVDDNIASFDGATGKIVQDSGIPASISAGRIMGRATGTGTGAHIALTKAQALTNLNVTEGAQPNATTLAALNTEITDATLVSTGAPFAVSETVETDGSGDLITAAKGTAYNKNFGTTTADVPEIGTALGNSEIVETDGAGKLITATKNGAYNVNFGTSAGTALEGSADAGLVHTTGNESIAGKKTFTDAIGISLTAVNAQIESVGNVTFMRGAAGKSKIALVANGAFTAEFDMQYGNDVNAKRSVIQQATSTQVSYGSSILNAYYNVTGDNVNHIFRGDTDNNLLTTDASQDAVGVGVGVPSASAKLQVDSTTKGALLPRVTTTQRNAIATPATGLLVYNTDNDCLEFYDGSSWDCVGSSGSTGQYGEMYFSTAAETSISTVSTPVRAAGTTTGGELQSFTMSANNTLRYDGAVTATFKITASFSMTTASNNKLISVYISKNGTELVKSRIQRSVSTGTDVGAGSTSALVSLATNDTVGLFISNDTDDTNATIEFGSVNAVST